MSAMGARLGGVAIAALTFVNAPAAEAEEPSRPLGSEAISARPAPPVAAISARPAPPVDPRDELLLGLCASGDSGLHAVAGRIARGELSAVDAEAITSAMHMASEPHVWPRAFTLRGEPLDRVDAKRRLKAWLGSFRNEGERRCGIASARRGDGQREEVLAVVALDAQADLVAPVGITARTGAWITIDAKALVEARNAKVVVLGPTGLPRSVPTAFANGLVKARFCADREGSWLAQVVLDGPSGPRPVLEALVFAGTKPLTHVAVEAPGERAGEGTSPPREALGSMIAAARAGDALPPLATDAALDQLAARHASAMMRARLVAHDVGDGDPNERMGRANVPAREAGENVAHAANIVLAHRALWASPSHRENLLDGRFTRLGIGVVSDPDGSVWVTELFASPAPSF